MGSELFLGWPGANLVFRPEFSAGHALEHHRIQREAKTMGFASADNEAGPVTDGMRHPQSNREGIEASRREGLDCFGI
jgi:hypothetical protein